MQHHPYLRKKAAQAASSAQRVSRILSASTFPVREVGSREYANQFREVCDMAHGNSAAPKQWQRWAGTPQRQLQPKHSQRISAMPRHRRSQPRDPLADTTTLRWSHQGPLRSSINLLKIVLKTQMSSSKREKKWQHHRQEDASQKVAHCRTPTCRKPQNSKKTQNS